MRHSILISLVALIAWLALVPIAGAGDDVVFRFDEKTKQVEPKTQIAVGLGFGLGGEEGLERTPSYVADALYFFNDGIAIKGGAEYNDYSRKLSARVRTFVFHFGPRLQLKYRYVTPFIEVLFDVHRYDGEVYGQDYEETRSGWAAAAGLSLSLGRHGFLDLTLRQVINEVSPPTYVVATSPLPPDDQSWVYNWGFGGDPVRSFYNSTRLEIQYRFKL
jgi:hypothetical protein